MAMLTNQRDIRRRVARRIGFFLASTVTSGANTTLTDGKHPVKSGNLQEEWLAGKWILRPDATAPDKVRVVAENGYTPAAGAVQPDTDWDVAPSAGEVYELHGAVEPWNELRDIINTALERCYVEAEIAVAATPGAYRHGLNDAAPWLQVPQHVRQIGWLNSGESRNANNPFRRTFWGFPESDEGSITIEHPAQTFQDGDTIYIKCFKPARYACRSALGVFGEQDGLDADTDEVPVALQWATASALVEYWDRYAGALPEDDPGGKSAEARLMRAAAEYDTATATFFRTTPATWRHLPRATGMVGRY